MGVDVAGDSVVYLEVARNVIHGEGIKLIRPDGLKVPLLTFPPGYPVMLAGAALVRLDVIEWARWLNCLALVAMMGCVGWIVRRGTGSLVAVTGAMVLL